jgi:hypothetical protein
MVKLGMFNSRMKDFFDLWSLFSESLGSGPKESTDILRARGENPY